MARDRIPIVVLGNDGRPLAGAEVTIRDHPAGTTATVYADDTSGATLANPLTSDARGVVPGWVERGMYQSTTTADGFGPIVEYFSAAPAGDEGIDPPWISDAAIRALADAILPVGGRIGYAGAGDPAPTGGVTLMLCDGRALDRASFAALFAAIGTTYGPGNGTTTFNIPDLRGAGPIAPSNMGTAAGNRAGNDAAQIARGARGGEVLHTLTIAELAPHDHQLAQTLPPSGLRNGIGGDQVAGYVVGGAPNSDNVFDTGGGAGHNNLGPYVGENALIRVA